MVQRRPAASVFGQLLLAVKLPEAEIEEMRSAACPPAVSVTDSEGCSPRPSDSGKVNVPSCRPLAVTVAVAPAPVPLTTPPNIPAELGRTSSARLAPVALGANRTSTGHVAPLASFLVSQVSRWMVKSAASLPVKNPRLNVRARGPWLVTVTACTTALPCTNARPAASGTFTATTWFSVPVPVSDSCGNPGPTRRKNTSRAGADPSERGENWTCTWQLCDGCSTDGELLPA